jgi:hypothetical protein
LDALNFFLKLTKPATARVKFAIVAGSGTAATVSWSDFSFDLLT